MRRLSANTQLVRWERAKRREGRLNPGERRARDAALEEARGALFAPARFLRGPWHGRREQVELASEGQYPGVLFVVGREPVVLETGALVHVPGSYQYRLDGRSVREGTAQYVFADS